MSSVVPSHPLQLEVVPCESDTGETVSGLGLPNELVRQWSRFAAPLERTVLVARSAGQVVGAAVVVRRHLSAYVKVGGLWSEPCAEHPELIEAALLSALEELARQQGAVVVKREFGDGRPDGTGNSGSPDGIGGMHSAGGANGTDGYALVPAPAVPGPMPDAWRGHLAPAGLFRWEMAGRAAAVPYMRQTTDFTCGPATLLMALSYYGLHPAPDRATEIALWREATTVGGCDPYGLAVAAARRGLAVALTVTTDGFFLLEGLESEQQREVRTYIQTGFRKQAADAGITVEHRQIDASHVRDIVESGRLAIVLIDEEPFHKETCPHWILVHSFADGVFVAHDPWTQVSAGESWPDAYDLPIRPRDLERIAAYGDPAYGAVLAVGPGRPPPAGSCSGS